MSTILQQVMEATTIPRQRGSRLAAEALKTARTGPNWVASQMQRARSPMGQLVKTGHRLNDRAHRLVAQLLDRNLAAMETVIDVGATRMHTAAEMMTSYAETLVPHRPKARRHAPARTAARRGKRTA